MKPALELLPTVIRLLCWTLSVGVFTLADYPQALGYKVITVANIVCLSICVCVRLVCLPVCLVAILPDFDVFILGHIKFYISVSYLELPSMFMKLISYMDRHVISDGQVSYFYTCCENLNFVPHSDYCWTVGYPVIRMLFIMPCNKSCGNMCSLWDRQMDLVRLYHELP